MSALGLLNFVLLQWLGIRLVRVYELRPVPGDIVGAWLLYEGAVTDEQYRSQRVAVGWKLLRWVWPLSGWWSDYRWIASRR